MDKFKPKNYKRGPEAIIQEKIIKMLMLKGWLVVKTHGNIYQSWFPDLYCTHYEYGVRWIEVKVSYETCKFTRAQNEMFPKFVANGTPIWILTAATELEYKKLFSRMNLMYYFMKFKGIGE